jgi:hypothetical protein
VIGVAAAMALSTGNEAMAEACLNSSPVNGNVTDNVANYANLCPTHPAPGQPGTDGVCVASIKQAVQCAEQFYANAYNNASTQSSDNYTITVGNRSLPLIVDLSHDTSLNDPWQPTAAAFPVSNLLNAPSSGLGCTSTPMSGCLVIQGNDDSSGTTLTTVPGQPSIDIEQSSHVMIRHLTLRQAAETMTQGVYVSTGIMNVPGGSHDGTFYTLTLDMLMPS